MARLIGINLPPHKRIEIGLTYIFGIGQSLSNKILKIAKISPDKRTDQLTTEEIARLKGIIEKNYKVEGELRSEIAMNIKRLRDIGSYRGLRHLKHLPARGQRTKTNSRTVRGNVRRTIAAGRKKSAKKV